MRPPINPEEPTMIDYRPDLFAEKQRLLDGELPTASLSPILAVTIERTQYPTPTRLILKSASGQAEIPSSALDHYTFRNDSWQVVVEPLSLPPLNEAISLSTVEYFPTLRSRIEAIESDPLSELEAISAEEAYLRSSVAFWPHTYVTPNNSKYGRVQSKVFNIVVVGIENIDSGEFSSHEILASKVIDHLQKIATTYLALHPYISLGLIWRELEKFLKRAEQFKSRLSIYLMFTKEIDAIYRNAFRSNLDGTADLKNVESEIAKFLKRESIVSSSLEKWERENIAEDVAWIACRQLGERPSRVENNGIVFEEQVAKELESHGYLVDRTPTTGDFGADLIAEKDDLRYAIQCKSHAKPIGIKAVQEAVGARRYYKCDYGVVVASSSFTLAAKELAQETGVILVANTSINRLDSMSV